MVTHRRRAPEFQASRLDLKQCEVGAPVRDGRPHPLLRVSHISRHRIRAGDHERGMAKLAEILRLRERGPDLGLRDPAIFLASREQLYLRRACPGLGALY
jgi:hypothetical protein